MSHVVLKKLLLLVTLLALVAVQTNAFVVLPDHTSSFNRRHQQVSFQVRAEPNGASQDKNSGEDHRLDPVSLLLYNRRQALKFGSALALASAVLAPKSALAAETATPTITTTTKTTSISGSSPNFDGLLDLPPVPEGYCRIFFCRHGQTENNRLRLVQGSRIDIPINELGQQQGQRAGMALARADPSPSLIYHSPLIRARQTAEQANRQGKLVSPQTSPLRALDALMEVDFGAVAEGQSVEDAKPDMVATYARWAMGQVDYRPEGGGDSGRDVINRAVEAVTTLAQAAASNDCPNRCIAVFSHSTYLRVLLAIFMGDSLAQVANLRTDNGGINVLDVNLSGKTTTIGPKSKLVGGFLSQAPKDFRLEIPVTNVVRVNEIRHLQGLNM